MVPNGLSYVRGYMSRAGEPRLDTTAEPHRVDTSRWVEVAAADLGRGPAGREFVRYPADLVWRYDAHLAGVATNATTYDDVVASMEAVVSLSTRLQAPLNFVTDLSRTALAVDNAAVLKGTYEQFGRIVAAYAPLLRRQAGLIANNWATPYWAAIIASSKAPWEAAAFFETAPLWAWLGTDPTVAGEIDALVAEVLAPDRQGPLAVLFTLVRAEPGIDLAQAARRLGLSPRSLQRTLASRGQTFSSLRGRLRLERAQALLANPHMKVEAIASLIGFSSSTHFTSWFRREQGVTPSQFRDAAAVP